MSDDLKNTIQKYFQHQKEVIAVYLFGSYASAKNRFFSDVDIGVILNHSVMQQSFALRNRFTVVLGRKLRQDIHITVLNTAGELLLKQVFQKGACVCVNHPDQLKYFKMTRYAMIAEFGYYLKMTQDGFCRALQR
ncbi:hypothetical protein DSCO28_19110 [Desulfosarcina ovata subsp. sediminis]|uniref:Polymerase beta nucleotidyltransferase domain-containing protein n=1 Tax=Desulfosarcina ovata subsp. sediminis TaxID=885957 RepID=A0A5K7ZLY6_9BACT|nr:nucleotidyltransferase domain-containing protein [Desulfosarcina ovata]BBO81345.1 hypothetical protein DSCO28_19110 [Desulfosarcina ovata subsp. sediminis]